MKLKLLVGAAAAAICVASGPLAAEPGWYGALDAGYHWPEAIEASAGVGATHWNFSAQNDWTGFARLGYQV